MHYSQPTCTKPEHASLACVGIASWGKMKGRVFDPPLVQVDLRLVLTTARGCCPHLPPKHTVLTRSVRPIRPPDGESPGLRSHLGSASKTRECRAHHPPSQAESLQTATLPVGLARGHSARYVNDHGVAPPP